MLYVGPVRWGLTLAMSDGDTHVHNDGDTHVHSGVRFVAHRRYQITKLNQGVCKTGDKRRSNNYTRLKHLYKIILGKSSTKSKFFHAKTLTFRCI